MKIYDISIHLDVSIVTLYEIFENYQLIKSDPSKEEKWTELGPLSKFFCNYYTAKRLELPIEKVEWDAEKIFQFEEFEL